MYVRSCLINDYQNAQGWSSFTNIQGTLPCPYPYYVTEGNWSEVSHWEGNALPETNDAVIIGANCNVNINVTIGSLTINNGKTLTVKGDKTLTVQGSLYNKGTASNFILENGSQLYHDTPLVQATVQKSIAAYSNSGGWNFVSSPVTFLTPSISNGLVSETETDYDLYYYHEPSHYWKNYKQLSYHAFYSGEGFLYANASNTTLLFSGNLHPGANGSFTTNNLSYSANVLTGWNLVGNPFPCNAYADRSYYVMNADGTAIEPNAVSCAIAIAPCTGIMVKATATGQSVTFTKETRQMPNNGWLQIAVARNESKDNVSEDKAIVSFNEGDVLEKFVFNAENAQLCIPQGNGEYAIAYAEKQGELPLNFMATKDGSYTLTVNPEAVEMEYLHLIDNMTGANVDLLQTPEYTFTAKTKDYASRFRLVFSANDNDGSSTSSETFAYYDGSEWVVSNEGEAALQVVDALGRIVSSKTINGNATMNTEGLNAGVYVMRLLDGENVKTQKIIVR